MKDSFFIVLYGVSGAGKSTLKEAAIKEFPQLKKLIALTTRIARQGEIEGVDKFFLTNDEFRKKNLNGELCLANEIYGSMYAFNLNDFKSGDMYICELYHRDYKAFQKVSAHNVNIYIKPKSLSRAVGGLKRRGSSIEEYQMRCRVMQEDHDALECMLANGSFNYTFINEYKKDSIEKFNKLIEKIIIISQNLE